MASVSYIIRSEKKGSSEVPIWVLIRSTILNIRCSTKIKVPFNLWDTKRQCLKPYKDKSKEVINRLDRISDDLSSLKSYLIDLVDRNCNISDDEAKTSIQGFLSERNKAKSNIPLSMNSYITYLIDQMKSGERLTKGKKYSSGSIQTWTSFNKIWLDFQKTYIKRNLTFDNVDMSIYSSFVSYCNNKPYIASTTKKYITILKAAFSYAIEDNITDNRVTTRKEFTKNMGVAQGKKVYLSEEEIESIFQLDLPDVTQAKVRDIFLIGCYCGQRVSDYNNIKKEDIIMLPDGTRAFSITQRKTNTRVVVPFLNDNVDTILKRWNYNLPQFTDVTINKVIKDICRQAKITSFFVEETIRGGKLEKKTKEKCDLVSTHTARRSAITNLYKKNLLTERELRSISGHKSEKSFEQYICLSADEQAEIIAEKLNKKL